MIRSTRFIGLVLLDGGNIKIIQTPCMGWRAGEEDLCLSIFVWYDELPLCKLAVETSR